MGMFVVISCGHREGSGAVNNTADAGLALLRMPFFVALRYIFSNSLLISSSSLLITENGA